MRFVKIHFALAVTGIAVLFLFVTHPVAAQGAGFALKVAAPAIVAPGDTFSATLRGNSSADLLGYTAVIVSDPGVLSIVDTAFVGTVWEGADFLSAVNDPVAGTVTVAAILDRDGQGVTRVSGGADLNFLHLTFRAVNLEVRTTISFLNALDANLLADVELLGHDVANGLALTSAEIEIVPPEIPFRRGDCNQDGLIDIADSVFALIHQFLGGLTPACKDACDLQDDGRVDLSDVIYGLNFLFLSGPQPLEPYPGLGEDPTEDALKCRTM